MARFAPVVLVVAVLSGACSADPPEDFGGETISVEATRFGEVTVTRIETNAEGWMQWCLSVDEPYAPDTALCTAPRISAPVDDGEALIVEPWLQYDHDREILGFAFVLVDPQVETRIDCRSAAESIDVTDDTLEGPPIHVRFHLVRDPECGNEARVVVTLGDRSHDFVGNAS